MPDGSMTHLSPPARIERRRPLISLTPLIDVVFILLVFFMLASSFLDWRAIDLSPPEKAAGGPQLKGAILIDIRPDHLRLAGERMRLDPLAARTAGMLASDRERRVLIRPATGVTLQRAVEVLDRLGAAGVSNMSFVGSRSGR